MPIHQAGIEHSEIFVRRKTYLVFKSQAVERVTDVVVEDVILTRCLADVLIAEIPWFVERQIGKRAKKIGPCSKIPETLEGFAGNNASPRSIPRCARNGLETRGGFQRRLRLLLRRRALGRFQTTRRGYLALRRRGQGGYGRATIALNSRAVIPLCFSALFSIFLFFSNFLIARFIFIV